eukprot:scaffold11000_cov108-Isochrysis_galbana.AAC.7
MLRRCQLPRSWEGMRKGVNEGKQPHPAIEARAAHARVRLSARTHVSQNWIRGIILNATAAASHLFIGQVHGVHRGRVRRRLRAGRCRAGAESGLEGLPAVDGCGGGAGLCHAPRINGADLTEALARKEQGLGLGG